MKGEREEKGTGVRCGDERRNRRERKTERERERERERRERGYLTRLTKLF